MCCLLWIVHTFNWLESTVNVAIVREVRVGGVKRWFHAMDRKSGCNTLQYFVNIRSFIFSKYVILGVPCTSREYTPNGRREHTRSYTHLHLGMTLCSQSGMFLEAGRKPTQTQREHEKPKILTFYWFIYVFIYYNLGEQTPFSGT